jgi:hypothetical protein
MGLFDWFRAGRQPAPTRSSGHQRDDRGDARAGPDPLPSDQPSEPRDATAASHREVKGSMLYPRQRYQGEFSPANLAFDSNLQEFAQRVAYICSLENSGKITPDDAHHQIKALWKELNRSHRGLGVDES